ncbi:MAG: type II secretion system protein [Candidatus Omnitrophica bacterium]|nr:type II secretion system protein [Candidatus Omnitrophota bacterium]
MRTHKGFTLMELVVVLIIMGVVVGLCMPNFMGPNEQARAILAQNNLMAIYAAQQNFNNDQGGNNNFCITDCNSLSNINHNLGLNIPDDGTYVYSCGSITDRLGQSQPACTATRHNGPSAFSITVQISAPIQVKGLSGSIDSSSEQIQKQYQYAYQYPNPNPFCTPSNSPWCPSCNANNCVLPP